MLSFSDNNQADVVEAFNSTSHLYIEEMVSQIYPTKLQLNKADYFDTGVPYQDLSITNGTVLSITYERDDFKFETVYFSYLDGDVPCSSSYGVYVLQLISF